MHVAENENLLLNCTLRGKIMEGKSDNQVLG